MSNKRFNYLKECRYGAMVYNINDIYVGRALHFYGEYSEGEIELFRQYVRPGDFVLDVGANIGVHTIFFAKAIGNKGLVLAFEPQRIIYQTLCANVALNSLINVICHNNCLSDKRGVTIVPILDPWQPNNFGGLELDEHYDRGEYVETLTIDFLRLPKCHFIKVDVEGMEIKVLMGARETINKYQPILFVENDRKEKSKQLIQLIHSFGYEVYSHVTTLYNPDNYFNNPKNIYPNDVTKNLLCIPISRNVVVKDLKKVSSGNSS